MKIAMSPIGYIESPYDLCEDAPCQGYERPHSYGSILIDDEFKEGIKDIHEGDKITVVFYFHKSKGYSLTARPRGIGDPVGVFSTRSPMRPNGIGISVVAVTKVNGRKIEFTGADMLNGTPVLDIKPYIGEF